MQLHPVGIIGTGKYVPDRILTNKDLEQMVETNDEWIVTRTGMRERRIAAPDQATSDLALHASKKALEAAGISAEELDLIIVATITPDMFFPSTACLLQEKLGAKKAAAFDLSAACSGFIYGLATASNMIATGMYKHVLVVGAECLSRITDYTDRNTCILFGDGAGAVVLGQVAEGRGFRSFELGADGAGGELLKVCAGGSRTPSSAESIENKQHFIYMAGNEVYKFAVRIMGNAAEEALRKAGLDKSKIDLLIPHQANIRIIQSALNRLDLSEDKCMINLDKYGNVSAASIPIALAEAVEQNRVKEGDHLVLVGFGGGLTWGASVLVW
ncbi:MULTISPECIES: beta-ketoacyl-ACP synthase III [Paenibacillus]|uniref:Beta-ketoacyl-[acyl-carrier-protein] synthase III n=1 Tax=Paenibacillus lignilyticus TaxID=1172615 RepID=A0ABS5CFA7_9BACL|nr:MULTISPECIES: beta-ketoacyl-ACP synthase III [Paenibacillus]MBP3964544.1 ketoacyl-ACP synthase III [Paenibacillus lignilyticus]SFS80082.1 3-oxoacyl-[acyl-carrier-protein] synthase III [Paenibacillus sp. BC26]